MLGSYLLTNATTEERNGFIRESLPGYTLYLDPGTSFSIARGPRSAVVIIGDCFDCRLVDSHPEIISKKLAAASGVEEVIAESSYFSGVYLCICCFDEVVTVIPDLCCLREAYYYIREDHFWIASGPDTLHKFVDIVLNDCHPLYINGLSKSKMRIGSESRYKDVKRLKPNHLLEYDDQLIHKRFFPTHALPKGQPGEVARHVAAWLRNILVQIVKNKRVMFGLTAGWDSRLLLAASRSVKNEVLFYTTDLPAAAAKIDSKIAKALAVELDLSHIVYRQTREVDDWVSQQLNDHKDPGYRIAFDFPGVTSVSGACSEIAQHIFPSDLEVTGNLLALYIGLKNNDYCIRYYNEWLDSNAKMITENGYRVLDLFFWEEHVANKCSNVISEFIAINKPIFTPFNCRIIVLNLMSVDVKLRRKEYNPLYENIMKLLWPEVLKLPINPSFKKKFISQLQRFGVYDYYRSLFPGGV